MDTLLDILDDQAKARLRDVAMRRRFRRGEVVFHAGDPANCLHVLRAGHCSVQIPTRGGDLAILTVLGAGATFGELALLRQEPVRSATVTALDAVETTMVTKDDFQRLRASTPALDRFLVDQLARYVRRQDARIIEALYVSVDKRVLRRLIAMSRLWGDGSAGTVVPLTQDVFASMAGTTRPTANQALRAAERDGLIAMERGRVRIVDPAGLARRAR